MGRYQDKILSGEATSVEEWNEYLREAHKVAPQMSPLAFDRRKAEDGRNSYEILVDAVRGNRVRRVLDLACGDGHLSSYIEQRLGSSVEIIGTDMSPDGLEIARKNFPRVTFKLERADRLSEANGCLDVVFAHMVLMLIRPVEPALAEISRVLKSGGVFAGVVPGTPLPNGFFNVYRKAFGDFIKNRHSNFKAMEAGDPRTATPEKLKELLSQAGFGEFEFKDFQAWIRIPVTDVFYYVRDMYNITVLPENERREFKDILISEASRFAGGQSEINFDFPMRLFQAKRL